MKRLAIILLLLSQILMLSGCWDMKGVENMDYLTAIGIDYLDEKYVAYVQTLNFTNVAKTEGGDPTKETPVWVGKGIGETLDAALFNIYSSAQQFVYWGHITVIVLHERVLNLGLADVTDFLQRFPELRLNSWTFGTKDSIEEIFSITSLYNLSPLNTILHEPGESYKQYSIIPPIPMYRFLSDLYEHGRTVVLPTLNITKTQWKEGLKEKKLLRIDGAFFLERNNMFGWIPEQKLSGIRWLTNETIRTPILIFKENKPIGTIVLLKPNVKITPIVKNQKASYDIKVNLKGVIYELIGNHPQQELKKITEETIVKEIKNTYKEGLKIKADVFGLGHTLYRKNPHDWHRIHRVNKFSLDEESLASIKVNVDIQYTGTYKFRTK